MSEDEIKTRARPTRNALDAEAKRLRELVEKGDATMEQAERLAEIEGQLRRYDAIRYGRAW